MTVTGRRQVKNPAKAATRTVPDDPWLPDSRLARTGTQVDGCVIDDHPQAGLILVAQLAGEARQRAK
jgi:hypothetical protein